MTMVPIERLYRGRVTCCSRDSENGKVASDRCRHFLIDNDKGQCAKSPLVATLRVRNEGRNITARSTFLGSIETCDQPQHVWKHVKNNVQRTDGDEGMYVTSALP
jgi:hypothetical protein